MLVIAGARTDA